MFDTKDGNALQTLSGNGASPNAFTGPDLTGYYFEGTDGFYDNLETLLSFVSVPYFTQESVDKEQGIIGQEIRMIEDNPHWQVYTQLMYALYQEHPVRNSVAGSQDSIAQINADTLYRCHEAFYHPSNMTLCVAGHVDADKVVEIARRILPKQGKPPAPRDYGAQESDAVHQKERSLDMEIATPLFMLGFKLKEEADPAARLRHKLIGELLCETWMGPSSVLYAKLYAEGLINQSFYCGYESYPGAVFLTAGGESRDPDAVRDAILQEKDRLLREGIDDTLFTRLKKAAYGNQVRALNSFEHLCVEQARAHFVQEAIWDFPQMYATIQQEDIKKALQSWVHPDGVSLSRIMPKGAQT